MLEAEPGVHTVDLLGQSAKQRTPEINTDPYALKRPSASTHHRPGTGPRWGAGPNGGSPRDLGLASLAGTVWLYL